MMFTNPDTKTTPYYVGESYRISSLKLDETETKPSFGNISDIKYTLLGAEDGSWFVSEETGEIKGTFNETGNFTMTVQAVDAGNQAKTVETISFNVQKYGKFKVLNYTRSTPKTTNVTRLNASDYTDPLALETTYAVGDTYRFAPVTVTKVKPASEKLDAITFTLDGQPGGFMIDPATGFVQGTPTVTGVYNVSLFATDSRDNKALVENYKVVVKVKDTDEPTFGPGHNACENDGKQVDVIHFDQNFTCNCDSTRFEGHNCETPRTVADTNTNNGNGQNDGGKVAAGLM